MKKNLQLFSAVAVLATTVMGLTSCAPKKNYAENNTKYKIGVSGPLTGAAAVYGLSVKNSAEMAVNEINAAGGVNGYQLELLATDDEHKADKAAVNYTNMYENGMQLSLACVTSKPCLEFGSYAAKDNVFCITPSATNDNVPVIGDNMYQMCFSDSGQGSASAEFITAKYPDANVGIFYNSSDTYSKGIYNNFKKVYKKSFTEASFTDDTATSFDTQINKLKNCDFIFMPIYYTEASIFIKQAKDVFASKVVYFGCDGLDGIDAVKGFDVYDYPQEISYLSHFNASSTETAVVNYVNAYKTAGYDMSTLLQFGAAAYDCVYALADVLKSLGAEKAPVNMSPSDMCNLVKAKFQGDFTFSGVTGKNMKWNKDGTVSKSPTKFVVNAPKTN